MVSVEMVTDLVRRAREAFESLLGERKGRVMIGVTGPPGAGKSTLADALSHSMPMSVVIPMDGFHLANAELMRLGLTERKGAPDTFDGAGFVHLLQRIRSGEDLIYAPLYSRSLHEAIGGAILVGSAARVVLVEGNYLLLSTRPWVKIRDLLDFILYLDAPDQVRHGALVRRQEARGLSRDEAVAWVERSDEANADVVHATRDRADLVLTRTA